MKKLLVFVCLMMCQSLTLRGQIVQSTQKGDRMMNIGMSEKDRALMTEHLQQLLANEYVLYTKTLKYHWNVEGKFFGPLHDLFGKHYEELLKVIDVVAERIRALGFKPIGTLQEFSSQTTLSEEPGINPDDTGMIRNLLTDYETIIKELRDVIDATVEVNDMGSNNMLAGLLEQHEKTAWMLRTHLQ